jgi:hypothetical protein
MVHPSPLAGGPAAKALRRLLLALAVFLATSCLAELGIAGVRLLRAERPWHEIGSTVPDHVWSAVRGMQEQARALGFR